MSLRYKVSFMLLVVFAAYVGLNYGIQRLVIFPSFIALEREHGREDIERCEEAIRREAEHLGIFTYDWSAWDDTYQFVEDRNSNYIKVNLVPEMFNDSKLDLVYFYNNKGEIVWGKACDLKDGRSLELRDFSPGALPATHRLIAHQSTDSCVTGIFMTEQGPMVIASRPIVKSNTEGPIRGAVIMGRFLGQELIDALKEQTRVDFQMWPFQTPLLPQEEKRIAARLSPDAPLFINADDRLLRVYKLYPDIFGSPALLIRADISRHITAQGATAMRFATASVAGAGLLILAALWLLLKRTVVEPLSKFTAYVTSLGSNGRLEAQGPRERKDEIGILSAKFHHMMEQLSEARKELMDQSYRSGMAEMASGVLHNVRNVLNPIIVSVHELRQDLKKAPLEQISQAQRELTQGDPPEERRRDINHFLSLAYGNMTALLKETQSSLDDLSEKTAQIERILADHEKFGHARRPLEKIDLEGIIQSSLSLLPDHLRKVMVLEIDASVRHLEPITSQRTSLLQVFANIFTNAAESLQESKSFPGYVRVSAAIDSVEGTDFVHLRIYDNGKGIDAASLDRIFERGFSTKREPSSGLGLHWCANTVTALKGRLYAESEGKGKGACFHLLLPRYP
jgi:two-component system NtrC family sensor kinase